MHPGPVNRGVELAAEVIDSPQAVIGQQVEAGVVVRMAVLYELLAGRSAPQPAPRLDPGASLMLDHRPTPARRRPDQRRPRARPARRASTRASTSWSATARSPSIGAADSSADGRGHRRRGQAPLPGLRRPARAPARARAGAQGGPRDRHALGGGRRLRRRRGDAEHEPDRRLARRSCARCASRPGARRASRSASWPASRAAWPARR